MGIINTVWGHLRYQFENSTGTLTINGKCQIITNEYVLKAVCGVNSDAPYYSMLKYIKFENENEITTIGNAAFYNCRALKKISIPSTVTKIENSAFNNCIGLEGLLNLPSSLEYLGNSAFIGCSGLTGSLNLPKSLLWNIRERAFAGCIGLSGTIEIPSKVKWIDESAFSNCVGVEKLILHENILSIGKTAFISCTGLTEINCKAIKPPSLGKDAFYGVNKTKCKLIIPKGDEILSAYRRTEQWRDFTSVEQR